jgi:hypothetical protein
MTRECACWLVAFDELRSKMNSVLARDDENQGRDASLLMSGMGHANARNAILI